MAESYLQGALRMAQRGDMAGAVAAVERARDISPDAPQVYVVLGQIRLSGRDPDGAREALEQAVALGEESAQVWELLGHAAFQTSAFRDALQYYEEAARRESTPFVWQGIGSVYQELYRPDSAAQAYERVLEMDSTFAPAWAALAEIREDEGAFGEALLYAERASRAAPRSTPIQYLRARLLLRTGRAGEAVPILEELVHRDSTNYAALYNLGLSYQLLNREALAEETLTRAARLRHRQRVRKQP